MKDDFKVLGNGLNVLWEKKLLFGKGKMGRRKDDLFTVCVA